MTTLKMAELAPIPSAKVITAIAVNPGLFKSDRRPKRMSLIIESMIDLAIYCRGGPLWPPVFSFARRTGGHGGPPLQLLLLVPECH